MLNQLGGINLKSKIFKIGMLFSLIVVMMTGVVFAAPTITTNYNDGATVAPGATIMFTISDSAGRISMERSSI